MTPTIHIVALGARTPIGMNARSSAAAARARVSRIREHPILVGASGQMLSAAIDRTTDPTILGWPRIARLAASALEELLAPLPAALVRAPTPLMIALPETRPGFGASELGSYRDAIASLPAVRRLGLRVESVGSGHAGALLALGRAASRLLSGACRGCVVGGADSYFDGETIDWLEADQRLVGPDVRGGFIPGEGAAFLLLVTDETRREWNLPSLATLRAVGSALETTLPTGELEPLGRGLTNAITSATRGLSLPDEAVDAVYCDINGERGRTEDWGFALLRTRTVFRDVSYETLADCWGDTGAASSALSCVLAAKAWARGYASGPRALVWGSSDGGLRAAALLQHTES
jgi:3-oxoacyl-[acyl-carrier-protein] synthase-1